MPSNKKKQTQNKRPIRYIEKLIASFLEILFPEARKQGINVGKNNPPKPGSNILEIPYVGIIIAKVTSFFNDISSSFEERIQENKTKFEQTYNKLKDNKIIASLTSKIIALETIKDSELKEVDDNIKRERSENLEEQAKIEKQIRQNAIAIAEHPYKNVFWSICFAVFFSIGILASEVFVNQKAFLFQEGENYLSSLIISIGISLTTFLFGFATAKLIQNSEISINNKIIYITLLSIAFVGVAYGVAEMRTKMMSIMSEGQTGRASFIVSKMTLILINIGFYISLIILKLVLVPHPSVFESNQKHRAIKKDTEAKQSILKLLKKELKDLPKKSSNEKKAIKKKFSEDKRAIEIELEDNYNELKGYQIGYNKNLSIAKNIHKQLSNVAKEAIGIFIQQINLFSSDDSQIKISENAIPELENPFDDYPYLDANSIDLLFNTETFKTPDYENY